MLSLNGDGTYLILRKKHLISRCYENTHHTASERRRRERDGALHMHISVYFWAARLPWAFFCLHTVLLAAAILRGATAAALTLVADATAVAS
jgi:hypothetical protein